MAHVPHVLSVQIGQPEPWAPGKHETGIRKQPVASLDVRDPGPREAGGRSGVVGDFVGDLKHHGGSEQAVYLVAREEIEYWERELARPLANGSFGENITTHGIDVDATEIGTRWQIGSAVLEVAGPRIPCRTFAWALDEKGWVKRFTQHRRAGAYAAVATPGTIRPDDEVVTLSTPGHGITVTDVFSAYSGDRDQLQRVVAAHVIPARDQGELEARLR